MNGICLFVFFQDSSIGMHGTYVLVYISREKVTVLPYFIFISMEIAW